MAMTFMSSGTSKCNGWEVCQGYKGLYGLCFRFHSSCWDSTFWSKLLYSYMVSQSFFLVFILVALSNLWLYSWYRKVLLTLKGLSIRQVGLLYMQYVFSLYFFSIKNTHAYLIILNKKEQKRIQKEFKTLFCGRVRFLNSLLRYIFYYVEISCCCNPIFRLNCSRLASCRLYYAFGYCHCG